MTFPVWISIHHSSWTLCERREPFKTWAVEDDEAMFIGAAAGRELLMDGISYQLTVSGPPLNGWDWCSVSAYLWAFHARVTGIANCWSHISEWNNLNTVHGLSSSTIAGWAMEMHHRLQSLSDDNEVMKNATMLCILIWILHQLHPNESLPRASAIKQGRPTGSWFRGTRKRNIQVDNSLVRFHLPGCSPEWNFGSRACLPPHPPHPSQVVKSFQACKASWMHG